MTRVVWRSFIGSGDVARAVWRSFFGSGDGAEGVLEAAIIRKLLSNSAFSAGPAGGLGTGHRARANFSAKSFSQGPDKEDATLRGYEF